MLNGGLGDFCLKTSSLGEGDEVLENIYQESWSTNTKNFLFIDEDSIEVTNSYDNKIEKRFYEFLTKKEKD